MIKTLPKRTQGGKCLFYFTLLHHSTVLREVGARTQGREDLGGWNQGMNERVHRAMLLTGLLGLLSHTNQGHLPRNGGPPISITNQENFLRTCRQII